MGHSDSPPSEHDQLRSTVLRIRQLEGAMREVGVEVPAWPRGSVIPQDRTRYWFDTEFMEDGHTIELLSIGVVCEDGREFYRESADANWQHANEWVRNHVLGFLDGRTYCAPRRDIAAELVSFVAAATYPPEFWAYYGDYDWVVLCQLFGPMVDRPKGWPMFAMDVKQLSVSLGDPMLPSQSEAEHHALHDARWTKLAWEFLMARNRGVPDGG